MSREKRGTLKVIGVILQIMTNLLRMISFTNIMQNINNWWQDNLCNRSQIKVKGSIKIKLMDACIQITFPNLMNCQRVWTTSRTWMINYHSNFCNYIKVNHRWMLSSNCQMSKNIFCTLNKTDNIHQSD